MKWFFIVGIAVAAYILGMVVQRRMYKMKMKNGYKTGEPTSTEDKNAVERAEGLIEGAKVELAKVA